MSLSKYAILMLSIPYSVIASQPDTTKTREYIRAIESLQKKDTTNAISLLHESIKQNNDAASCYELAKILSIHKTHSDLTEALKYSRRAVELDGKNIPYRLLLARIREDLFYASFINLEERSAAKIEYEKILEIDSTCAEAFSNLGRLHQEDFHKYFNSFNVDPGNTQQGGPTKSGDVVNDLSRARESFFQKFDTTPKLSMMDNAESDFKEAENSLLKVISIRPDAFDNYLLLAKLYIEGQQPSKIISHFKNYIERHKENKDAYMYLGLAYYMVHENEKANKEFQNALVLFSQQEVEELKISTARLLLEPIMKDKFSKMTDEEIAATISRYWSMNDPLLLTTYNESILEHYSRAAYSNLFFSVPKLNLIGWKTERGETLIRYGYPQQVIKMRPNVLVKEWPIGGRISKYIGTSDQPGVEIWIYPEKIFQFVDEYRNTNYTLLTPNSKGNYFFPTASFDSFTSYKTIKPREYLPTFEGPSFNLTLTKYQLKADNGLTDTYFVYGIDATDSLTTQDKFSQGIDLGIYFFDEMFNSKYKKKTTIQNINSFAKIHVDNNRDILVSTSLFTVEPTSGSLAFEMLRKKDNGVFSNHSRFEIKEFANIDFNMSDIIVCVDLIVNERRDSYIHRGNISFLPNPTKSFSKNNQLYLYYEIYNLKLNTNKLTDFEQKITIQRKEEGGVINSLLSVVGLDKEGKKIALTSKYQTQEKDPQMYLQLDMSKYEPGEYLVTVSIKDIVTGKEVSNQTEINWQ